MTTTEWRVCWTRSRWRRTYPNTRTFESEAAARRFAARLWADGAITSVQVRAVGPWRNPDAYSQPTPTRRVIRPDPNLRPW